MKKSLLALMLAIALVSLTACGSKVKEPEATATPVVTEAPTAVPTEAPTAVLTEAPTAEPTEAPTAVPTEAPTAVPTEAPTAVPTEAPTAEPTAEPVVEATAMPTAEAEADAQSDEAAAAVVISETTEEPVAEEAALTLSDDVLASAYNGAVTVLKSEIQDEYDQMLSQYVAYYAQYGYSVDEYDTELQASVAQETVQTKLSTAIVRHYAAQNGYELTEEKKTELAAQEMETAEAAPEEAMEEPAAAEAPEASEKSAQTLPGADCFAVVPESITRVSADFQLTCEEDAPLALRSEYWLETQTDGEWQPLDAALLKTQEQTDEAAPETAVCTLHYDWQTLYGELNAGEYRLAQPVILPDGSGYTLYAEFTVE